MIERSHNTVHFPWANRNSQNLQFIGVIYKSLKFLDVIELVHYILFVHAIVE